MKTNKLAQDLKRGDFICGLGHVQSINIFADVAANLHSARQSKQKRLDKTAYASQVKFEQDVQYRPSQSGRVSVTLVGGGNKSFDLNAIVQIWSVTPYKAKAA
jgi:hypothetical protein